MRRWLPFLLILLPGAVSAQNSAVNGFCEQGAESALVQGLPSTNTLQGVAPLCLVTVYLTGTTNLATIYSNIGGTPLSNPFTANTNGQYLFFALTGAGLDIVRSSGTTLTDVIPGGGGGGGGGSPGGSQFSAQYNAGGDAFGGDSTILIDPPAMPAHSLSAPSLVNGASPVIDLRYYGADPTGVTDSTTAILNAATAGCQTFSGNLNEGVTLLVPPGLYHFKNLDLSGLFTIYGCRIYFYGYFVGGEVFEYDGTGTPNDFLINIGGASYGGITGIEMKGENTSSTLGTEFATSTYLLELSAHTLDNQYILYNDQFYGSLSHAIYAFGAEWTNFHLNQDRWDHIGGCAVYVTGSGIQDQQPLSIDNWTVDNAIPTGSWGTYLTSQGLSDGTHWGDAPICLSNGSGGTVSVGSGRYEQNSPPIVIGNNDNALLVRMFSTVGTNQTTILVHGVAPIGNATLNLPEIASDTSAVVLNFIGSGGLNSGGCMKNTTTQQWFGGRNCEWTSFSYGQNVSQGNGISIGAVSQVPSKIMSTTQTNLANGAQSVRFYAGDIVVHPNSEIAPGTQGAMRWVTAPLTGACHTGNLSITAAAIWTTSNATIGFTGVTPAKLDIKPGDNLILKSGGAASADLPVSVSSVDYVGNTVTVSATPSTAQSPGTIQWQSCTLHELPGAATGSAAPSSGTWAAGERVYNTNIATGQPIFWTNSVAGTPGTWVTGPQYGAVSPLAVTGVAVLVSGTVTVTNAAACTPSSSCSYSLTRCIGNSSTAVGTPTVGTVSAGTSFVINSLSSTDTTVTGDLATVCWRIN